MQKDYFPQGIAKGDAFLGRDEEIKRLKYNIKNGHHTLLLAPRRFGKTSLAQYTLAEMKLVVHRTINFYLSQTARSVEAKIFVALNAILNEISGPKLEKLLKKISAYFSRTKKKWTFGFKGVASVEFNPESHEDIPDNILTALTFLDELLQEQKKKVVLFLDEIQELHQLDQGRALQGSLREFAQQSKNVVFIFSGSNRRLLHTMFDDKSMPLYELCERIKLDRIAAGIYEDYIKKVSKKTMQKQLSSEALATIFEVTKRHPKRVYNLCYALWQSHTHADLTAADVHACWNAFVDERVNDVRIRLKTLAVGQIKVLTLIALDRVDHITGKQAQQLVDLTSPSIIYALNHLEQDDYIERDKQGRYIIIDPLVKTVLKKYEQYNLNL